LNVAISGTALGHHAGALLDRHADAAAARRLHDRVAALGDAAQDLLEQPEVGDRLAGLGLAHVDVDDRGPGGVRGDRGVDDLLGRDGDRRALAGDAHAPRDGAGAEHAAVGHAGAPSGCTTTFSAPSMRSVNVR